MFSVPLVERPFRAWLLADSAKHWTFIGHISHHLCTDWRNSRRCIRSDRFHESSTLHMSNYFTFSPGDAAFSETSAETSALTLPLRAGMPQGRVLAPSPARSRRPRGSAPSPPRACWAGAWRWRRGPAPSETSPAPGRYLTARASPHGAHNGHLQSRGRHTWPV